MKIVKSILIYIFIFSLVGCATKTKPLADDSVISSVHIKREITAPERLNYIGNSLSFGLIGVLVAGDKKEKEWKAVAKENNIKINDIVFNAFENEMKQSNRFPLSEDAETSMNVEIVSYGLTVPHGLSNKLHPTLIVRTQIIGQAQNVMWEHLEIYDAFGKDSPLVEKNKLQENPELLYGMWKKAAENVAKESISKI